MTESQYDVIVVGGGPAGLSAATVLGRCRWRVLVLDDGEPRNARSLGVRGFLTRDGTPPLELLRIGREELVRYGVEVRHERAMSASLCGTQTDASRPLFEVTVSGGDVLRCRKLLLATGVCDELPEVDGISSWLGRGVYHCPHCDGFEHQDEPLGAIGRTEGAGGLALALLRWSADVTFLTQGAEVDAELLARLGRNGVKVVSKPIECLEGSQGGDARLEGVRFTDGSRIALGALFFSTGRVQHSELPALLGAQLDERDEVETDRMQHTDVHGVFLAGDADGDVQFAIVAAAEGAKAAVAINLELLRETLT